MDLERMRRTRQMILNRVLLAPSLILLLVYVLLIYYFAVNLRARVQDRLVSQVQAQREQLSSFLAERTADLRLAAADHPIPDLQSANTLDRVLRHLRQSSRVFFDLGLFDDLGNLVSYIGPYHLEGRNYAGEEWFLEAQTRDVYISDVFEGYRRSPHFVIVVKKTEAGRDWFLRATVDTYYFEDLVGRVRTGFTGDAYLVNGSGIYQTGRREHSAMLLPDPDFALYGGQADEPRHFSALSSCGRQTLYATGRLWETGWILVVTQESSEAFAPLLHAVQVAGLVVLIGGAVVVVLTWLLVTKLSVRLIEAEAEKRALDSQLLAAGKMAEVGEMSSAVAHEINNPLQIIAAEQALLSDLIGQEEKQGRAGPTNGLARDSLREIATQVERGRQITAGLLKFARRYEPSLRSVRLAEIIDEVAKVAGMAATRSTTIRVEPGEIEEIVTDPALLQQVVVNLVNNAVYAVRERPGGEVVISTRLLDGQLALRVADNGSGIKRENLEKVFTPFFTTKPAGQGTGLGLSTVAGVVKRLGGTVEVQSEPGQGATFTVRLPLTRRADPAPTARP